MQTLDIEKPRDVVIAVRLLWISLILGPLKLILDKNYIPGQTEFDLKFFIRLFIVILILAIIPYMIGKSKNWARIIFSIGFIGGTVLTFPYLHEAFLTPITGPLSVAQFCLNTLTIILLFTKKSREWFKLMNTKR